MKQAGFISMVLGIICIFYLITCGLIKYVHTAVPQFPGKLLFYINSRGEILVFVLVGKRNDS
jgi:hypothetical protein